MADNGRPDLSREATGQGVEVAEGLWVVSTRHHPGGSASMPEINNRAILCRVEIEDEPCLVCFNAVSADVIPEVQRIEKETGLSVKLVVSPGGGHHFLMPPWVPEFPEATFLLPPTRVPRTNTGKELLKMDRVELMDLHDPLPMLAGQIDALLFHGIAGAPDRQAPGEGGSDGIVFMLKMMWAAMFSMNDPTDELWIFHRASGTLVGGENLGWMYEPGAEYDGFPRMMKGMLQVEKVAVFKDARKVTDKDTVEKCWRAIGAWPATTVMSYHDLTGYAWHGDGQAAIIEAAKAAGQLS